MSIEDPEENTTRVTDKGQTTIPKALREKYGIEPGDVVLWDDADGEIVVRKVLSDQGRGMLFDENVPEKTREAIVEEMATEIRERRTSAWAVE